MFDNKGDGRQPNSRFESSFRTCHFRTIPCILRMKVLACITFPRWNMFCVVVPKSEDMFLVILDEMSFMCKINLLHVIDDSDKKPSKRKRYVKNSEITLKLFDSLESWPTIPINASLCKNNTYRILNHQPNYRIGSQKKTTDHWSPPRKTCKNSNQLKLIHLLVSLRSWNPSINHAN